MRYIVGRGRVILQNEKEMSNALSEKRLAPPTWQAVLTNPQWRPNANGGLDNGALLSGRGIPSEKLLSGNSRGTWVRTLESSGG